MLELARRRCGLRDGALQAHGGGVALLERRGVLLRRLCLSRALGVHRDGSSELFYNFLFSEGLARNSPIIIKSSNSSINNNNNNS